MAIKFAEVNFYNDFFTHRVAIYSPLHLWSTCSAIEAKEQNDTKLNECMWTLFTIINKIDTFT